MTTMKDQLKFIYQGGKLKRFHARDTLTSQNIADHSFGVAWLVYLQMLGGDLELRPQILLAALAHDLGEYVAGDVPGDTKKRVPELKIIMNKLEDEACHGAGLAFTLSKREERILKFADIMEGLMFCIRERRLGSKACNDVWANYWEFAQELAPEIGSRTSYLLDIMNTMWQEAKDD